MAGAGLHIDPQSISHRCAVNSPDYKSLTPLDWVVLDFTDGKRSFGELSQLIPATKDQLTEAYLHLRLMGLIHWTKPETQESKAVEVPKSSAAAAPKSSQAQTSETLSPATISDDVCAQYLSARWIPQFREFQPELTDATLDIPVEAQIFAEFMHQHLSKMTHHDLLGLPEGSKDKAGVRQGYMMRTKQFHPDRYFRKNTGVFAPRIAAIFKAVTVAFTTLQTMR